MRALVFVCAILIAGCTDQTRVESFTPRPHGAFTYSAQVNTVMTPNADGSAERIRREWLAEALGAHRMCAKGYAVVSRRLVAQAAGPFSTGADVVYAGHCL